MTTDSRHLAATLASAAQDLREACHLTKGEASVLREPSDAYKAIGALQEIEQAARQLTSQIREYLEAEQKAGRLACDSGGSSMSTAISACAWLQGAEDAMESARGMLEKAHEPASHLKRA